MKVCRRVNFNAAHRLFRKDWSDDKNNAVFGKCNNPNYHGHNYILEVWIDGEIDPETGYVIDLKILNNKQSNLKFYKDAYFSFVKYHYTKTSIITNNFITTK